MIPQAPCQIYDRLATVIDGNSRADFMALLEVGEEAVSDGLEPWFDVATYSDR
jgi:hypothetical protein